MNRKIRLILINASILVILIIVEIILIRSASGSANIKDAAFALKEIKAGTTVTADMLEIRKADSKSLAASAFNSADSIVGKKIIHDMAVGEIFYTGNINDRPGNTAQFENEENRLFAMELKGDAANGWWIAPGQRADVFFIPGSDKAADKTGINGLGEKIENLRIAAILDEKGNLIDGVVREAVPRYVCLEVTPEQAVFLAYAKTNGKIEMAIRPDRENN